MFDAATAVQEAAFGALDVAAVTNLGAAVWQHVPEATPEEPLALPIVVVGDIALEPIGGKDGGLDRASFEIITMSDKPDRSELSKIQAAVRGELDRRTITANGAILSQPVFVSAEGELLEDGVTYLGKQKFETLIQPA